MPVPGGPPKNGGRANGRAIGPASLGPLLWGLGCVLTLAEDPILTARHRNGSDWQNRSEHNVTARPENTPALDAMIEARARALLEQRGFALAAGYRG